MIDGFGVELLHPCRKGRSRRQIGRKGLSNHRWIVGGKLGVLLNGRGEAVAWDAATANVYDAHAFNHLAAALDGQSIVLADGNFNSARGDPPNLKVCRRKTWGERMVVETMLSMLTVVCRFKRQAHRTWAHFRMHLGAALAAFNLLVNWHPGGVRLSIAEFSLQLAPPDIERCFPHTTNAKNAMTAS